MLFLALFAVGITYAVINLTGMSDQNLIKSGKISMHYTESSNVINLTNALPMTDNEGKIQSEYFDFSISSNADTNADDNEGIRIPYDLIIEPKAIDSDKDALTNEQIKVYLTKIVNGSEIEVLDPIKISELATIDTNFNLYSANHIHNNGNGMITAEYRLRAWIDYDVDASTWSQTSKPKQYKFGVNVNATGGINITGANKLIKKVGQDGLVAESHPATEQLAATIAYRYTGENPNNNVNFNNERWRIIGIFDVDDGKGNIEKRIKIIRHESIGVGSWNSTAKVNDWTTATGMTLLNSGDYWNRTGDYATKGLTRGAKQMIDNAKWYLGETDKYNTTNTIQFYSYERGTTLNEGKPTSWVGNVALMYPSDYGYATSGGTTNRDACLAKEMIDFGFFGDCADKNWLTPLNSTDLYTLTTGISDEYKIVFFVSDSGGVGYTSDFYSKKTYAFRPTVYLKSDIQITGGTGTQSDPYTLSK